MVMAWMDPNAVDTDWVFGYGSLIWNPEIDYERAMLARAHGYHRAFCITSRHYRGTAEAPGVVLGLDRGGSCIGLAFRLHRDQRHRAIEHLYAREMLGDVYRPTLAAITLADGSQVRALTFVANRTSADWLSRDEEQVDAYLADPLCSHKSSVSMFRDMMGGLQYIARRENLARMDPDTPVYFFSGDQDPVGGMGKGVRKVYAMFQAAGCRDVTLKLYPGGRHEMFNELDRQQVFDDLLAWLEAHMPREGRA